MHSAVNIISPKNSHLQVYLLEIALGSRMDFSYPPSHHYKKKFSKETLIKCPPYHFANELGIELTLSSVYSTSYYRKTNLGRCICWRLHWTRGWSSRFPLLHDCDKTQVRLFKEKMHQCPANREKLARWMDGTSVLNIAFQKNSPSWEYWLKIALDSRMEFSAPPRYYHYNVNHWQVCLGRKH